MTPTEHALNTEVHAYCIFKITLATAIYVGKSFQRRFWENIYVLNFLGTVLLSAGRIPSSYVATKIAGTKNFIGARFKIL
jgi:hypothetical protein